MLQVLIHPLSIAGWCGAITTALNLLPVGCLDGGRMVQVRSAAGRPRPPLPVLRCGLWAQRAPPAWGLPGLGRWGRRVHGRR
jgi:membrane-associated protease RseP (regulator of RpoE activity)